MRNLFNQVEVHWLKLFGAALLIFAAIYLPLASSDATAWNSAISAVLSAVGGALLADAFDTPARFLKTIAPRLNSINRLLATVTSQIASIITTKKENDGSTTVDRLCEVVPTLRVAIADVSDLAGEKFDPNVLNETIDSIGELMIQIESGKVEANSPEIMQYLQDLQENLRQETSARVAKTAQCPYQDCGEPVNVELAPYPSTSKVIWCQKCSQRFHAQLKADGSVGTVQWGGSAKSP